MDAPWIAQSGHAHRHYSISTPQAIDEPHNAPFTADSAHLDNILSSPHLPLGIDAASAAEAVASGPVNPVTLATQLWEYSHTLTGLPWWVTIPTTALALRTVLLPLTVKAKGAAVNFSLMSKASIESKKIYANLSPEEQKATSQKQIRQSMYGYLRQQQQTPSTWWYAANVLVQVGKPPAAPAAAGPPCRCLPARQQMEPLRVLHTKQQPAWQLRWMLHHAAARAAAYLSDRSSPHNHVALAAA